MAPGDAIVDLGGNNGTETGEQAMRDSAKARGLSKCIFPSVHSESDHGYRVLVYVYVDHVSVCGAVDRYGDGDFEECHFMLAFLPYTCKDRDEDESDHSTGLISRMALTF